MRKTFPIFVIIACSFLSENLFAQWKYFLTTPDGDKYYLSHIKKEKNFTQVWTTVVDAQSDTAQGDERSTTVQRSAELREYDCERQRSRSLMMTLYYVDGSVNTFDSTTPWSYIIPGSIDEAVLNYLCEGKKPSSENERTGPPATALATPPSPPPPMGETVHGYTDGGNPIELHPDGTWNFSSITSESKKYIDPEGRFSISLPSRWVKQTKPFVLGAQFSFLSSDPVAYGAALAENIPLTQKDLEDYTLAQGGSLVRESNIDVGGKQMHLIVLDRDTSGLSLRLYILNYTGDSWYVRFQAWSFKSIALKDESEITSFFDGIQILKP